MAIHYDYIKGYCSTQLDSQNYYTKIIFSNGASTPEIKMGAGTLASAPTEWTSYGNIVTTNPASLTITTQDNKEIHIPNGIDFYSSTKKYLGKINHAVIYSDDNNYTGLYLYNPTGENLIILKDNKNIDIYSPNKVVFTCGNNNATEFRGGVDIKHNLATTGYIKSDSYIEGLYFNATSDKRAKHNIIPVEWSGLDAVKKLQVYNFNYNHDNSAAIGIIAQEAEDIKLGNFSIVEKPSDPENMMSVHESKLVYILLKAVQEQQKEIEELKKALNK